MKRRFGRIGILRDRTSIPNSQRIGSGRYFAENSGSWCWPALLASRRSGQLMDDDDSESRLVACHSPISFDRSFQTDGFDHRFDVLPNAEGKVSERICASKVLDAEADWHAIRLFPPRHGRPDQRGGRSTGILTCPCLTRHGGNS